MNRDATIVQVALLLIIIAILWVAILKQQRAWSEIIPTDGTITPVQVAVSWTENDANNLTNNGENIVVPVVVPEEPVGLVERKESDNINVVKSYFRFIAEKDYASACNIVAWGKCNAANPSAIENFSTEFKKFANGYEYINIRDYGIVAPSGKDVVCVKYSYRYAADTQPGLVSEIMSFYIDRVWTELKITDRVCEKKYKDNRWVRDCPIQASINFCEGLVR